MIFAIKGQEANWYHIKLPMDILHECCACPVACALYFDGIMFIDEQGHSPSCSKWMGAYLIGGLAE